ncbi:MAG: GNAT family N-acetyltransferase [Capsulimonas sp.]|uniref:GNAT family N-acetyltransferase n=1 Tax=Capsulimonas sp. TaxID=2494211 RepID=UPI00326651E2
MSHEITRLTAGDYEELMDFISLVFSMAHAPTDFRAFGPKMYEPTDASMAQQYVLRENGRIRAAVGVFPMTYCIGDISLRVAGVGNVAVHKYHGGKGYMVDLMNAAVADMANEGMDFSFLTGQRQRYQHFGYEPCGAACAVHFTPASVKHTAKRMGNSGYRLEEMAAQSAEVIGKAYAIHAAQFTHIERPREKFVDALRTGMSVPYVIFDQNGEVSGYFTRNGATIGEILVADENAFADIIHSVTANRPGESATVFLPPHEPRKLAAAIRICENYVLENAGNYRFFNFARTVEAFLTLKASYRSLPEGEMIIGSDLFGNHTISIAGGSVAVETTDRAPDVTLRGMDIYQFLFGAAPMDGFFEGNNQSQLAHAWFPAPLYFPFPDHV